MDVRCPQCRRAVSEWAARCPTCRTDLAHADLLPRVRPSAGRSAPRLRRRPVAAGIAVVSLVVVSVLGAIVIPRLTGGRHGGRASPTTAGRATAAARHLLGRQRLFIADGATTEAVLADGTVLRRVGAGAGGVAPRLAGQATVGMSNPVVMGPETVAYLDGGSAYALDVASRDRPTRLGPAEAILAAGDQRVDLVTIRAGRQEVTTGDLSGPSGPGIVLPAAVEVVGATTRGLVVEEADRDLEVVDGTGPDRVVTGPVSRLVAVAGGELAWTSVSGCSLALTSDCPLHLTNLTTGAARAVPLDGALGFAGIGALSPDGRSLAIFSLPAGPQTTPRLDLSIIGIDGRSDRRLGSVLVTASVTPTVTWSANGQWIFYGGAGSFQAVDVAPRPGGVLQQPLPVPISPNCCVVGF